MQQLQLCIIIFMQRLLFFLQIKLAFSQAAKLSSHLNRKTVVLALSEVPFLLRTTGIVGTEKCPSLGILSLNPQPPNFEDCALPLRCYGCSSLVVGTLNYCPLPTSHLGLK